MITDQHKPLFRKYSRISEVFSNHYENYREYKMTMKNNFSVASNRYKCLPDTAIFSTEFTSHLYLKTCYIYYLNCKKN